jgi:hypothetical protein
MPLDEAKNLTYWTPALGKGSVVNIGTAFIVDQSDNFIIDQSKNFIVTTPSLTLPPNLTAWTATPAS